MNILPLFVDGAISEELRRGGNPQDALVVVCRLNGINPEQAPAEFKMAIQRAWSDYSD